MFFFVDTTEFRYNVGMTLKQTLINKKISTYTLAKNTKIPYSTICDLVNGRTNIQNISLKYGLAIANYLNMEPEDLLTLTTVELIDFRYFRNNLLHDLKRTDPKVFVNRLISRKEIDFCVKNNGLDRALYLLALIDYLCRQYQIDINPNRYSALRKEKLDKPLYPGSDLIQFETIEEAEKQLGITVLPEFRAFNIIEEDVWNVA